MGAIIFGLIVLVLTGLSVRERVRLNTLRDSSWNALPESKPSPLSQAILNLMGFAGGIYLSLAMLVEFLKIELPNRIDLGEIQLEPLAAFSIALAIVQPFILKIFLRRW